MKTSDLPIKAMQINLIGFIDSSIEPEIRAAKGFVKKERNEDLKDVDIDVFRAEIEKLKKHIVDFECS